MIHIDFNPADPKALKPEQRDWWTQWEARAQQATIDVLNAWEASRRNPNDNSFKTIFKRHDIQNVWAELKDWLLVNVFNDKCAYCETKLVRDNYHAEHYRPKGKVTRAGQSVKVKDAQGQEIDHPGYFWLAFHWKNLLPSCAWCNTGNGKRNEFPIPKTTYLSVLKNVTQNELDTLMENLIQSNTWPDIFYFQPVDLDRHEGRLLLHPYFDNPRQCLKFNEFGKAIPKGNSDQKIRGKLSIQVYNLNQEKIVTARREAQKEAFFKYHRAISYLMDNEDLVRSEAKRRAKEHLSGYIAGKEPYSAAVVDFMREEDPTYFK